MLCPSVSRFALAQQPTHLLSNPFCRVFDAFLASDPLDAAAGRRLRRLLLEAGAERLSWQLVEQLLGGGGDAPPASSAAADAAAVQGDCRGGLLQLVPTAATLRRWLWSR